MTASEGGDGGQDFELNLASIIDCFTVLITYLLVSASFISLSALDVTVADANAPADTVPPDLAVTVTIKPGGDLALDATGKETLNLAITNKGGVSDLATLGLRLKELKQRYPTLKSALVTAADSVQYKSLVATIEAAKATLPEIAVSADMGTGK